MLWQGPWPENLVSHRESHAEVTQLVKMCFSDYLIKHHLIVRGFFI